MYIKRVEGMGIPETLIKLSKSVSIGQTSAISSTSSNHSKDL